FLCIIYVLHSPYSIFSVIYLPLPRSTLFPYTTLFRSNSSIASSCSRNCQSIESSSFKVSTRSPPTSISSPRTVNTLKDDDSMDRSEEHTSELQSRFDLVCRLLLEKKKNN